MKTKLGLILLIIGVALIITSQTVDFTKTVTHTFAGTKVSGYTIVPEQTMKQKVPNEELINGLLYSGIGLLVIGGISFALGLNPSLPLEPLKTTIFADYGFVSPYKIYIRV